MKSSNKFQDECSVILTIIELKLLEIILPKNNEVSELDKRFHNVITKKTFNPLTLFH